MKNLVLLASCILVPALVVACSDDSDTGSSSSGGNTSSSGGGSSSSSSSSSSGGSSSSSSSSGDGGGSSSSGDGGSSSGDGGTGEFAATCAAQAARVAGCGGDEAEELADCQQTAECYDHTYRPGAGQALGECLAARPCGTGDDECYADVGAAQMGNDAATAFTGACTTKLDACEADDEGFSDDYCSTGIGLAPQTLVDAATACFDKPCGEIEGCIDGLVEGPFCD